MQNSPACEYFRKLMVKFSPYEQTSIHWYEAIIQEAIPLETTGLLQVHSYTSFAQIPLKDTAITVTDSNGDAIAMALTNRSGLLDNPISIPTPPFQDSQQPTNGTKPFTTVNLYARIPGYEEIFVKNVQIFPDTITVQNLEMIPLSEFPETWNKGESFDITAQNL